MSTIETRSGVTAPPSGNAAAPGLGEAFSINLNTGQGVYSYKLALPEGRAGHGPKLALEYAHGSGLGPFGLGWRLGLRAISRRLDFGVPGVEASERWLDGAQEIVETPDGTFAATRESAFTRYRRAAAEAGGESAGDGAPGGWLIEEAGGAVHECGLTEAGRVADPDHPDRVQEWLVERSLDACDNAIEYAYERDGGVAYPASVSWAAYELRFVYEERPDARQDARVLQVVNGEQWYWPNRGDGHWGEARPVAETPTIDSFGESGVLFADADGSATADMIVAGAQPLHGYFENGGADGWSRFVAYPRGHAAAPPWSSGTVRLMDADGDGRVDAIASDTSAFTVWRNGGPAGWSEPQVRPIADADGPVGVDFADPLVQLADMNGDGLLDVVRVRSGSVEYWPGLGDGNFGARVTMASSPRLRGLSVSPDGVLLIDVDGDGCADLVRVNQNAIEVVMNRSGREFADPVRIGPIPAPLPGTLRAVNMNGRAGTGLLWSSLRFGSPAHAKLEFSPETPPYLLTSVDNGSGLRSELSYRSAVDDYLRDADQGALWTTNLPFPMTVVASTREVDAISGQETVVEYSYHDGHFAPSTRQFQGFRRTERIERGDESRPDTLTVSHFLMDQEREPGHGPEHVELNGMLARTEVVALDGTPDELRPYRIEECDHELELLPTAPGAERPRALVKVTAHRTDDSERTDDVRGEEKTYEYDSLGRVVRETTRGYGTRGGVAQPERVLVTEVEHATSATRHLLDKPARIVERDGAGAIVRERRRYYDGSAFEGMPLGEADRGLLVREEELVLSRSEFEAHYDGMTAEELGYHTGADADGTPSVLRNRERCGYDARGVKRARRDALGNEESYEHDPDGLFRTLLRDSLGETRYVVDRAVGQPTSVVHPDGSVAGFAYDAQGRVTATLMPGDDPAAPPRTYSYDDVSVPNARRAAFRASPDPGDVCTTVTYFDGHGREAQKRVEAGPGRVIVSTPGRRNPWGAIKRDHEPRDATSLGFTRPDLRGRPHRALRYDALGRVVETVDFGGGVSRAEYRPFELVLTDPDRAGTPRREEFDVLRMRTRVVQELGDGEAAATSFDIGPAGDVVAVRNASGTLTSCTYDRTGRRLVANHREGGLRRLFYDARGATVRSLDADGRDLRAELDARGRLRRLTLDGGVVEELGYDDPARNALDRIASASYPGGRQDFTYDEAGRVVRHEYAFDGADRVESLSYEYDGLGRELAVTHTDGRRIERELTVNGWVGALPGIVDEVGYDARGLPTTLLYANGAVTEIEYTPGPGHVRRQRTTGPAGQVLHDVGYERDGLGLISRSDDATPGGAGVRDYVYDPLGQLREVTSGGDAPLVYSYDSHYNLTGLGDTGATLHHDDPDRPYRLTGVTPAGGSRETVGHDACGNVSEHGGRTFSYDYKQALTRFEDGRGLVAEYGYDAFGARVSKLVDDGRGGITSTFFLGNHAEVRNGTPTLFARIGDLRVAVLQPGSTRYVHPDPLGTTAFFTDESGVKVAAIAYLPFGNVAAGVGDIDQRCFGSHPFDAESGLYYMQRRHYDPATARFLQPDPIAVLRPERCLTIPRAFHPYAYVGNDPLNNADPDGLSFWTVVGAIAGLAAGLLFGPVGFVFSLVAVSYVAIAAGGNGGNEFALGFLIGLNAGLNAILAGAGLATIGFLAAFEGVASSEAYQAVLGWSSWLMPMSWIATGVGLAVFATNLTIAGMNHRNPHPAVISTITVDWPTGTIVTRGGVFAPHAPLVGGYNLGNFMFVNPADTTQSTIDHEAGHTLSNAAFGGIFHFIGAFDEAVLGRWWNAFPEWLAQSNDYANKGAYPMPPGGRKAWWSMWD